MTSELGRFPHCDARVLHAPGECEFCDRHPDWQQLREVWGIAFTGHVPVTPPAPQRHAQLPCPADFNRPAVAPGDHRAWGGNVATGRKPGELDEVERKEMADRAKRLVEIERELANE